MNETALIEVLRSSADFSSVSERSLGELARSGTVREPVVGSEIVKQGEPSQQLWILLTGELEILIDGDSINRIDRPGDVVGQISAVSMIPATATVRVASPSTCLCVPHRTLHQLFGGYPDLAEALLRSMAKYLGAR
ncbi:MAG: cyclic nucleotide-binding domain-containing protein [Verrucomicrobiales bacterium]|jgi:thioredoxin reductase (NADPH)|nr:cyclic nucleotide-binding domain-containing protein [Verrucomicrobiales bacterium]